MNGYEKIKKLAKEQKCNIPDLIVLSREADPFFTGSKAQTIMAEWFVGIIKKYFGDTKTHLRRMHYKIQAYGDVLMPDGGIYENSEKDLEFLNSASRHARHLGLIDHDAINDNKNKNNIFNANYSYDLEPSWDYYFEDWFLPHIEIDLTDNVDWSLPTYTIENYYPKNELQKYHIEIYIEKSTMEDMLEPICKKYGINLITGTGFLSITAAINTVKRVIASGKPGRILYLSDYDPAGCAMPLSISRHMEYYISSHNLDVDIKLEQILMTKEVIEKYNLPRTPIKDSDKRKGNFEEIHGEGCVELDALAALHGTEFSKLVEENILRYWDRSLNKRIYATGDEASYELQKEWTERIQPHEEDLDNIKKNVREIVGKYKQQLEQLSEQLKAELEPYKHELNSVKLAIQNSLDEIMDEIELPPLPEPEADPRDEDFLFDSGRDYLMQLESYKARKAG